MGSISKDVFRRIYALYLVGLFPEGAYGAKRLQKTNFWAELSADLRPFTVEYHHHGQFSHELAFMIEQLASMHHLTALPFSADAGDGNRYQVRDRAILGTLESVISDASAELLEATREAVRRYGFLASPDLLAQSYEYLRQNRIERGSTVVECSVPETVQLPSHNEDACADLELAFSPDFVQGATKLKEALEATSLDLEKVPAIAELPARS